MPIFKVDKDHLPGRSFKDLLDDFIELEGWLARIGINISATRLRVYKEFLIKISNIKKFNPRDNESDFELLNEQLYQLREIHELLWIFNGIKDHPILNSKEIESAFKVIVGGNDFAKNDRKTTARNYQYELRVLSYFARLKFEIDYSKNTDVIAIREKRKFYIECKRLASENQIDKRLKEAAEQLQRKIGKKMAGENCYGIAAVDVTKILYPDPVNQIV